MTKPRTDAEKRRMLQATALINAQKLREVHMLSAPISAEEIDRYVSRSEREEIERGGGDQAYELVEELRHS